jgi:hypothetical protein
LSCIVRSSYLATTNGQRKNTMSDVVMINRVYRSVILLRVLSVLNFNYHSKPRV